MKTWYSIKAQATATAPAEVSIYGDIGAWGVTASKFIADMRGITGPILVRINSGGGDVFDGLAIYHYLAGRGDVETVIDGLAASAASLPFLAGAKRKMPSSAFLMIHNPWSGTVGDAAEMRKAADVLERIGDGLASVYASVTGMAKDAVQALMDAETWLDGNAALAGKWATDVLDVVPVMASVGRGRYAKTPAAILAAAPNELVVGDYVELTYSDATTKGEVVEVLTSGTAAGADGEVGATADDPAAIVKVLRETATPGEFEETDVQVARLFSALTKVDPPRVVEVEEPEAKAKISAPTGAGPKTPMKTTAKLLALLGLQPAAEDTFLASAIADLGVTAEAVQEARKSGTSDFLAQHITARIGEADARAKAANDIVAASCKALGIDVPATPEDAAKAIPAAVAKAAADALAARGVPPAKTGGQAQQDVSTLTGLRRAVAAFAAQRASSGNAN